MLQGTTGSGKTIVYFKQIEEILKKGYQAIILLPEIGLTSEFEKKFEEFFGFKAAIWHSGITPKRKKIIWSGLANEEIKVTLLNPFAVDDHSKPSLPQIFPDKFST